MVVPKPTPYWCLFFLVIIFWVGLLVGLRDSIDLNSSCETEGIFSYKGTCAVGNIAGLCSCVIWSICLVPQIFWNYHRQSVEGLSLSWSCANALAALTNLNFVARRSLPLYVYLSAIYMPILDILVVSQFIFLSNEPHVRVLAMTALAVLFFGAFVIIMLWKPLEFLDGSFEWMAVCLWSVEVIPQLWLNARLGTTIGQADKTLAVTFLGKSIDFVSMACLKLPVQFQIMTMLSTSSAYVNIMQRFLFPPAEEAQSIWGPQRMSQEQLEDAERFHLLSSASDAVVGSRSSIGTGTATRNASVSRTLSRVLAHT